MNREQAINYLKSSGMSDEQIKNVIDAFTCEDWYDVPSDEMTLEQARQAVKNLRKKLAEHLEQEPCEMTVEKYRQRMIQAFHNADTDGLIALCVLPTEKEFEHLEWLLKNHYKKEPCEDCISRQAVLDIWHTRYSNIREENEEIQYKKIAFELPSVTPQQIGKWIPVSEKPQEGRYLCTYEHCDGKCIDFGSFDGDVWYIKPIAYMPLPEPYKLPAQTFGCAED